MILNVLWCSAVWTWLNYHLLNRYSMYCYGELCEWNWIIICWWYPMYCYGELCEWNWIIICWTDTQCIVMESCVNETELSFAEQILNVLLWRAVWMKLNYHLLMIPNVLWWRAEWMKLNNHLLIRYSMYCDSLLNVNETELSLADDFIILR